MAAFWSPEGRAVKSTTDTGRLDSIEILRVAHGVAMGILIMQVPASSWMQGLIVIDRVLYRACWPSGDRLVYIFWNEKESTYELAKLHPKIPKAEFHGPEISVNSANLHVFSESRDIREQGSSGNPMEIPKETVRFSVLLKAAGQCGFCKFKGRV